MKKNAFRLLSLLLALLLLPALVPAALAEGDSEAEGLLDEDYLREWMAAYGHGQGMDRDWQDFSVGFCYTPTGDCWFYNGDVFMYSASMYKVPVSMLIAEKIASGEFTWTDTIQGSTVEYLVQEALVRSNNDYGHVLAAYLGGSYSGKCSDQAAAYTDLPADYFPDEFYRSSYYSARFMTQVLHTLYEGGEERFPRVIDYMLQAQPEEYMNLKLKDRWPVAQKYGAYDDGSGYNNNHDAAIIYTPSPIIVVVMTRNVSDYQNHIANIANFLAEYSLTLDEKLAAREAERAEAEDASPAPLSLPEASPAETPPPPEADAAPLSATGEEPDAPRQTEPAPTPEPAPVQPSASPPAPPRETDAAPAPLPPALFVILGALALLAVPVLGHALGLRRRRKK